MDAMTTMYATPTGLVFVLLVSDQFSNCTLKTIKACPFLLSKNIFSFLRNGQAFVVSEVQFVNSLLMSINGFWSATFKWCCQVQTKSTSEAYDKILSP
jgi:adenosine/AMP kinase